MVNRKLAVSFGTTKLSTATATTIIEEEIFVQPGVGEQTDEGLSSERVRESKSIRSTNSSDTERDPSDRRNGNSLDENLQIMYSSSIESETDENVKNIRGWAREEKWQEIHEFLSSSCLRDGEAEEGLTTEMKLKYACTKWIDDGIIGRDYQDIAYGNCNLFQKALNKSAPEEFLTYLLDFGGKKLVLEKNDIGQSCLHCVFDTVREIPQSIDFIMRMIDIGGKELLVMQDVDGRSALHILMRCPFVEGVDKLNIMRHMYGVGGKEVFMTQDKKLGVPTALHLAFCLIGENGLSVNKTIEIIRFMMKVGGDDLILATDGNGLNILHYACMATVLTTEVIDIAVRCNPSEDGRRRRPCLKLITGKSRDGKLPIDYLLRSHDNSMTKGEPPPEEKRMARRHLQSIWASIDHYALTIPPHLTDLVLEEKRKLDEQGASADTLLDSTFTKAVLNQFSVTPFAIAILFVDLAMQSVLIVRYSSASFDNDDMHFSGFSIPLIWFTFREISQLRSMSRFRNYTSDPSNWLDLIQILITLYVVVRRNMSNTASIVLGILVSWIRMIFVFGNISYSIGVFVSAILKITSTLVPFLFVTIIIVMAFAHSFRRLGPLDGGIDCPVEVTNGTMYDRNSLECLFQLYFQTISMFLSSDWIYLDSYSGSHSVLSIVFALIVGILLLNIIIALITNVFTEIQKDSENAFWSRRLRFVIETDTLARTTKALFLDKLEIELPEWLRGIDRRYKMISEVERRIISKYDSRGYNYDSMENSYVQENMKWFFSSCENIPPPPFSRRILLVLVVAEFNEIFPPSNGCIGFVMGKKQGDLTNNRFPTFCGCMVGIMIILLSIIAAFVGFFLGLFTFGYFWPKEVKHAFFCGKIVEVERDRNKQEIMPSEVENVKIEISRRVEKKIAALEDKVDNVFKVLQEIHEVIQTSQPSFQQK